MKIKCLFWMVMITFALPLAAQTESGVFAPFVSRLESQVDGRHLHLSWRDSQDIRGPVYIFKSDSPFLGPNPVLGSVIARVPYGVQSFAEEIDTDEVFYYFAVASDMNDRRFVYPIPDTNTIAVGLRVEMAWEFHPDDEPYDPYEPYEPYMHYEPWSPTGMHIQPGFAPIQMLPRAFARDLQAFQYSGDDHALSTMIRNNFTARDWEAVKNELFLFLAVPRDTEARDRARFYLGQSFYFLHQPKEALFEFLTIMDRFPNEISGWIQASYNMINFYSY